MALKTFSMEKTCVTANGLPITGWADGDAITVEFNEDNWTHVVGADGEVTRVYQSRKDATITLRLGMGSTSNAVLANLKRLDEQTGVPINITIIDFLLGDKVVANQCWCMRDPGRTFGQDASPKEWTYVVAELTVTHGGGSPI
jgi:hypothetical protein